MIRDCRGKCSDINLIDQYWLLCYSCYCDCLLIQYNLVLLLLFVDDWLVLLLVVLFSDVELLLSVNCWYYSIWYYCCTDMYSIIILKAIDIVPLLCIVVILLFMILKQYFISVLPLLLMTMIFNDYPAYCAVLYCVCIDIYCLNLIFYSIIVWLNYWPFKYWSIVSMLLVSQCQYCPLLWHCVNAVVLSMTFSVLLLMTSSIIQM